MSDAYIDASLAAIFVSLLLAPSAVLLTKASQQFLSLRKIGNICEQKWAVLKIPISHFFCSPTSVNNVDIEPCTLKEFFRGIHICNLTGVTMTLSFVLIVGWFSYVFSDLSFWNAKPGTVAGLKIGEFRTLIVILVTWLILGASCYLSLFIAKSYLSRAHDRLS